MRNSTSLAHVGVLLDDPGGLLDIPVGLLDIPNELEEEEDEEALDRLRVLHVLDNEIIQQQEASRYIILDINPLVCYLST